MKFRFILKTTLLTSALFIAYYPSNADLWEIGGCWGLVLAVYLLAATITWKTEYPKATAWVGLRLAYRSWFRPDAPRAPSCTRPSRPARVA